MSPVVEEALGYYRLGDATICRRAYMAMNDAEKDEYLTSVRELDDARSD